MYLGEIQYFTEKKNMILFGIGSLSWHEYRISMICLFVGMGYRVFSQKKATPLFDNNKKTNSLTS